MLINKDYLQKRFNELDPKRCPGMQPFNLPSNKINRTGKKKQGEVKQKVRRGNGE